MYLFAILVVDVATINIVWLEQTTKIVNIIFMLELMQNIVDKVKVKVILHQAIGRSQLALGV